MPAEIPTATEALTKDTRVPVATPSIQYNSTGDARLTERNGAAHPGNTSCASVEMTTVIAGGQPTRR